MHCNEVQQLIVPYMDGEVDLVQSMIVEAHLDECASCRQAMKSRKTSSHAFRAKSVRYGTASGQQLEEFPPAAATAVAGWRRGPKRKRHRTWAPAQTNRAKYTRSALLVFVTALLVFGTMVTWNRIQLERSETGEALLEEEIASSHVRSVLTNHLQDVSAAERYNLADWFVPRLPYAPAVVDIARSGFPLYGARLDVIDQRPVAVLVYNHTQFAIDLFEWPSTDVGVKSGAAMHVEEQRGVRTIHFTTHHMTYFAASYLDSTDLKEFVQQILLANES